MALIACRECGSQISDQAASCPHCGCPVKKGQAVAAVGDRLTTVQQTSKALKIDILWGYGLMFAGILMSILTTVWLDVNGEAWSLGAMLYGIVVVLIGACWMIITRIRIWWHHQ